ncbi:MAG: sigma-70 family RNA polymerase sigma factor [Candidatus Pseudobacter hemicellulosilyticus]|uniref:Sigma-70 family RNA polymerase sigma factor n=1 Tax=Candidatus Pseudobacter hemicellulosilyticus TaxID=3121375 RepID=A0AAJ5WXW6_9BACT|nr:MAG: sigma-70 family RNA polymerase sigma factor [Pseudobacter sp.]
MDKAAFLAAIEACQGILHKICYLYQDSKEDREDLFQEMVFQLWKGYPGFRGDAKISTWIYRIALNTAITSFRKKRPSIEYPASLPELPAEGPDEEMAGKQALLFRALKQLDDGEKAIITLYLEGLSYRQIGEIAGISENNVGVKLNRIKTRIQTILNT